MLICTNAWADTHYITGTHSTRRSPQQVWNILVAYGQTCARGCKYERPNLVRVEKLDYLASDSSWYTWSLVNNALRDVTYFSRVTVRWDDEGGFTFETLQLDASHQTLIGQLSKKTGRSHKPAFDTANTTTSVFWDGRKTSVNQTVKLTTSGLLDLWPGKVDDGIREYMSATFRNIGP
ncbi:MAG TPA: hypothetical protein VN764_08715 [Polyangiaceae bacterium]|nr:hypothetical protein [Polyangiaceae bacterium]